MQCDSADDRRMSDRCVARGAAHVANGAGRTSLPSSKAKRPHALWLKRVAVIGAVLLPALLGVLACLHFGPDTLRALLDVEFLRDRIEDAGVFAQAIFIVANVLQVVIAVLPGEPLELAAGYAFGFVEGTTLCLLASALAAAAVVLLVRRFGMRVVGLFFSPEKVASARWLRDAKRFELVFFLVFLVPGTPKDLLTYIAGFSEVAVWRIVALATLGRVPSVVSSTLAAGAFSQGNWAVLLVTAVVTLALAVAGVLVYRHVRER